MKRITSMLAAAALALTGLMAAPHSAQAAANVCTGVSGCRIVGSSDIDGDKKPDQIGMVYKTGTSITTRVKTATRTMSITGKNVDWYWEPLYGITAIDGARGKEIVVGSMTGANTTWNQVVTYRSGRLVTLKPPRASEYPRDRWAVQASYNFNVGFTRSVSSTGVVRVVEKVAERKRAEGDNAYYHAGTNTTYEWRSGKWIKISTKKVDYSDKAGYAVAGWHIAGLHPLPYKAMPKSFKTCASLNKTYKHGVGRFGARDRTSGTPVTNFNVRTFTYYKNIGPRSGSQHDLDDDNDGIACEKR